MVRNPPKRLKRESSNDAACVQASTRLSVRPPQMAPQTEAGISQEQSMKMARNLMRATLGEVLWMRDLVEHEEDFEIKEFGGVRTHLPKNSSMVGKWLEEGVFEALERGERAQSCN
jgi:hypothetical protein